MYATPWMMLKKYTESKKPYTKKKVLYDSPYAKLYSRQNQSMVKQNQKNSGTAEGWEQGFTGMGHKGTIWITVICNLIKFVL